VCSSAATRNFENTRSAESSWLKVETEGFRLLALGRHRKPSTAAREMVAGDASSVYATKSLTILPYVFAVRDDRRRA
jgi:hypothetical protein